VGGKFDSDFAVGEVVVEGEGRTMVEVKAVLFEGEFNKFELGG
jgi:hypothetical protein